MGIGDWLCSGVLRQGLRAFNAIAATVLIIAFSFATSRAGDIFAQPSNGLSITNSVSNVLPQAGGAGGSASMGAAGAPAVGAGTSSEPAGAEAGWLSGLHISGYANETFGMWQNPTTLKAYTRSRNNLAVARSLLQIDENYRLNENNPFYSQATLFHSSFGHVTNDFYNNYQVRDAWWENKTGPLTTFIGNQIVVWGQSLAFRVGDVVNPTDTCWAFGFANLEQSRDPQWMIHPILNLPEIGPLTSNFIEVVVEPGFQPRWWPEQTHDPYNKFNSELTAGRVNPCYPAASHGPSARFDVQYSTDAIFGANAPLAPHGPYATSSQQLAGPCVNFPGPCVGANLVDPPAAREFFVCLPGLVRPGFNPYPKNFHPVCNLGLSRRQGNYGPIGDGLLVDAGFWRVPGMQPENWNEGVRLHTLFGATEWTLLYYNDNVSGGAPWSLKWTPYTNLWNYSYYPIQEFGVTMDRPLPMPASIAEYFPAVFRGEMLYQNHVSFESNRFQDMNGQRWSDVVKYMLALDIDQAYAPWLTTTGNLTVNLEEIQTTILDNAKFSYVGNDLSEQNLKNDVSVLFNVGTSWWWSDFAPTWTMIWNPKGDTFALFPSLTLNPPWTKKYFLKLQAIEILGGDKEAGVGLFKGQSYLIAQLQYNFNLL